MRSPQYKSRARLFLLTSKYDTSAWQLCSLFRLSLRRMQANKRRRPSEICIVRVCVCPGGSSLFITLPSFALMLGVDYYYYYHFVENEKEPSSWMDRNLTSFEIRHNNNNDNDDHDHDSEEKEWTKTAAIFRPALNKNETLFLLSWTRLIVINSFISFFGRTKLVFFCACVRACMCASGCGPLHSGNEQLSLGPEIASANWINLTKPSKSLYKAVNHMLTSRIIIIVIVFCARELCGCGGCAFSFDWMNACTLFIECEWEREPSRPKKNHN